MIHPRELLEIERIAPSVAVDRGGRLGVDIAAQEAHGLGFRERAEPDPAGERRRQSGGQPLGRAARAESERQQDGRVRRAAEKS